jgi:glycosyltransferase involved in cell wall biosynthesis
MKLSVLVPLFNEEEFAATILERVVAAPLPAGMDLEIIVVDDGSTDGSADEVRAVADKHPGAIRMVQLPANQGKGAALARAIHEAQGDFAIIQDADLEYNPMEYERILRPLVDGRADAVYGSRFLVSGERRVLYYWHSLANRFLTGLCNIFADLNLTDMETGYKAFRTPLLKSIPVASRRFGFEPEITIKLARRQARVYEIPISYNGRTYEEGKKIGFTDAIEAVWVILWTSIAGDLHVRKDKETLEAFSDAPRFNAWMADTIRPYVGKQVLELGAGIGNLSRLLVSRRRNYVATDLDREHLERLRARLAGRPNLETAVVDLSRAADFAPFVEKMDTVVCLNVLEHIEDDLSGLRNIRSALVEGGRAVILVPEGQSIFSSLDQELGHYRRYSPEQLQRRMTEAGFALEALISFNRVSRPGWWLNGKVLGRRTISRYQLRVFDHLVWLVRRIDPYLPWSPTSIIAVGRKVSA